MAKLEKDYLDHNATLTAMVNEIEKIGNNQKPRQYLGVYIVTGKQIGRAHV